MADKRVADKHLPQVSADKFLAELEAAPRAWARAHVGRLAFIVDATLSRARAWDWAVGLQARMLEATAGLGSALEVALACWRGIDGFHVAPWSSRADEARAMMETLAPRAGPTRFGRALRWVLDETARGPVRAAVFIGDALEESLPPLEDLAAGLRLRGCPGFFFLEGGDSRAAEGFARLARASGGGYARFMPGSDAQLLRWLEAVSAWASGGEAALTKASRAKDWLALIAQRDG